MLIQQFFSTVLAMGACVSARAVTTAKHQATPAVPGSSSGKTCRRSSAGATYNGCDYVVPGVGSFNTELIVDFSSATEWPSTLEVSNETIAQGTGKYSRTFNTSGVVLNEGDSLSLIVPGGQNTSPILGGQFATTYSDILYGSVRTVAMASTVAGSIHGFFFYKNDNQETDIEIRTTDTSKTHFTNQPLKTGASETTYNATSPSTITSAYHEYRCDWLASGTYFYIDGVLSHTITSNVPTTAGQWMWNNWSNGGIWSAGPPSETNELKIQSITAYFNRTSVTNTCSTSTAATTAFTSTSTSTSATPKAVTTTTAAAAVHGGC